MKKNNYNSKIKSSCNFISNPKDNNNISYKPFGGCFEDENDSQYDQNPQNMEQKKGDKNITYEDDLED